MIGLFFWRRRIAARGGTEKWSHVNGTAAISEVPVGLASCRRSSILFSHGLPLQQPGAQYLDPEEHLLSYWGKQQQVRKGKDGLKNWT